MIRYYEGLSAKFSLRNDEQTVSEFANFHLKTMRRKGFHCATESFLMKVRKRLGDNFQIASTIIADRIIASTATLLDEPNNIVFISHVAYDRSENSKSALLHNWWQIVNWAASKNHQYINFGNGSSNKENPNYRFKKQFGGEFITKYIFSLPISQLYSLRRAVTNDE